MRENETSNKKFAQFPKLHSFCIGLPNSPDIKAAEKVAKMVGTIHHGYTYTIQEGLDVLPEVIYHLETFDVTTIRASTPMFLMSRKIKAMGIKMVLSGEGADEIFGGYLYFHKCPNPEEMQAELKDKIMNLHKFDCLRANKSSSAWGLELRTPFLDADFMEEAMDLDPAEKMTLPSKYAKTDDPKRKVEKYCLRKAFETPDDAYLPPEILWRQKEQFSDGVGYGWIDSLRDLANKRITDVMFANAKNRFPVNTPLTKEAYMYRAIFEEHFPHQAAVETVPGGPSIACSTPRAIEWDESFKNRADCSGRAVSGVHDSAYDSKFEIQANAADDGPTKKRRVK
jgi:asparagine synthase (glutamine-hydrolysing)